MLGAVLTLPNDKEARCTVVKLVDRIYAAPSLRTGFWLGTPDLLTRTDLCVRVADASPAPIHGLRMLIFGSPREGLDPKRTTPENYCDTLLQDSDFNGRTTQFQVADRDQRLIDWDGLGRVWVAAINEWKWQRGDDWTLMEIHFAKEVPPGSQAAVAFGLSYPSRVRRLSCFRQEVALPYFSAGRPSVTPHDAVLAAHEIPCRAYLGTKPFTSPLLPGGFDVFVYYPPHAKATTTPSAEQGITKWDRDGRERKKRWKSCFWRMRKLSDAQDHTFGTSRQRLSVEFELPSHWVTLAIGAIISLFVAVVVAPPLRAWLWEQPARQMTPSTAPAPTLNPPDLSKR